ncbi:MAG: trp operon repressor [Pasteurellaceae bacterium]|nr:trp operon repressor [Pasteurellaceae bacterium]
MKDLYQQRNSNEWKQVLTLLRQAVMENREEELLSALLTLDEKNSLGLRVQIIRLLLDKDITQREIQQQLTTSAATITRGSNMLKALDPDIRQWIHRKLNGEA